MNVLVAGLGGQLGHGLLETAPDHVTLTEVRRAGASATAAREAQPTPRNADRCLPGDVTKQSWGLDDGTVASLADSIDVVLNLAAETNWSARSASLYAANVVGAVRGRQLTDDLERRSGRRIPYIYTSTIYVAGGRLGPIPETGLDADPQRLPYEQSKWEAETRLLSPHVPGTTVVRVCGLIGSSSSRRTRRRNSLYLLADQGDRLPGRLLPACSRAKVDVLPRDLAGEYLLRIATASSEGPTPPVVHLAAGEGAPSLQALLAAARSLDLHDTLELPRILEVPPRALLAFSQQIDRLCKLSNEAANLVYGLRYIGLPRTFERSNLASCVGPDLPNIDVESVARMVFPLPEAAPVPSTNGGAIRRFRR